MKLLLVAVALLHLALGASIVDVTCPDSCTCQVKDQHLETLCESYEFIKKLLPKQKSTIVRLNINNASLVNIDSKLKYLKNLYSLDLSHNSIATLPPQFPYLPKLKTLDISSNYLSHVEFAQLPKNLQLVDLSNNQIRNFPKDWQNLKQLKTLHFHDNPIDCDCSNLLIYEQMIQGGIYITENLTCHYPKEYYGQALNTINCSLLKENLLNSMLGDEAGSGLEELESHDENKSAFSEQEQFINAEDITENSEDLFNNEEGSGDEGSGMIPILPITSPKACHFNCSTPKPIGLIDEKNASPPPGLKDQIAMIFDDLVGGDDDVTTPTPEIKEEPEIVKESDKNEVETFPTNDTVVGEMERASVHGGNNQSLYIIVFLLVAFVIFVIIYVVNKRRRNRGIQRKRNKSTENGYGEELKPLGKSAEAAKPVEQINSKVQLPNAEAAPLLNGQNGKITDDGNLKFQPVEEDEKDVELRKSDKQELLTPQPERVTIKAGELPDSVPKTPLFVHRQVNSDGEIVTTAVNSN